MCVLISKLILNYILLHVIFSSRCNLVLVVPKSILLINSIDPVDFHASDPQFGPSF